MISALLFFIGLLPFTPKQEASPSGLIVEFIRDPVGVRIMDLQPEFTWVVPAGAGSQSAYRIIVAGSPAAIEKNEGDIWDSGVVNDSRSVEIQCSVQLKPGTSYFWKVMIRDRKGKWSGFSAAQPFRTGNPDGYETTGNKFLSPHEKPLSLRKISEGLYLADFGKAAFGTLQLETGNISNDSIIIHLGEKLDKSGRIDRNPGGTIRYSRTVLKPSAVKGIYGLDLHKDKRNTTGAAVHLPDSFGVVVPFRYCEVENFSGELTPSQLQRKSYHVYYEDNNSIFTSDDSVLNAVWEICQYSIKATTFAGLYVDGDRERIPYEADAYINQLGHYYTDREYSIARRTNEYFIDHPTWPTEWILQTVPMFYSDIMFTGNAESAENFYEALRFKTLTALAGKDHLISSSGVTAEIMKSLGFRNEKERIRDIVDWPPAQKDTGWKLATAEGERDGYEMVPVNTVVNAFYYNGLVKMSQVAGITGRKDDSLHYAAEAEKVKASFNDLLIDKTKGCYRDGAGSDHSSLHANMMPLAFGMVPDEYKKSVTDFIKSRGMACSVYGAQYLLEALYRAGEADYALELMTAVHDRSWYNMIRVGSTITLEAWDMKYKPNSDWNHAWGAAPANIIPGFLWGIAPVEPGWKKAVIKPQPGRLKYSSIMVPTIRGKIIAELRKKESGTEYIITIPGNMECDLVLPGKTVKLKPGLNKVTI